MKLTKLLLACLLLPTLAHAQIKMNAIPANPGAVAGTDSTIDETGTTTYTTPFSHVLTYIQSNIAVQCATLPALTGVITSSGCTTSWAAATGSGSVVLATSPTLITPALGTPSALVLTNATALPASALPTTYTAGSALGGTELLSMVQSGAVKSTTPDALNTYVQSQATPINGLPAASSLAAGDNLPIYSQSATATQKITGTQLATFVAGTLGANPTATVGTAAVNGSATTFLRSDAAPAVNLAMVPTWTGIHTFSAIPVFSAGINTNNVLLATGGTAPTLGFVASGGGSLQMYSNSTLRASWNGATGMYTTNYGYADASVLTNTPTTGFSITLNNANQTLVLTPAGTLATGTITLLGTGTSNGLILRVTTSQTVTALTVNGGSGTTVVGAPTTLTPATPIAFIYVSANTTWYRFQ
jgi:hypothetical protein